MPKSIVHFLINKSKDLVQNELVSNLYKEELFDELLEESPVIAQRRQACIATMEMLRKAHEILNQVRDYNINWKKKTKNRETPIFEKKLNYKKWRKKKTKRNFVPGQ